METEMETGDLRIPVLTGIYCVFLVAAHLIRDTSQAGVMYLDFGLYAVLGAVPFLLLVLLGTRFGGDLRSHVFTFVETVIGVILLFAVAFLASIPTDLFAGGAFLFGGLLLLFGHTIYRHRDGPISRPMLFDILVYLAAIMFLLTWWLAAFGRITAF